MKIYSLFCLLVILLTACNSNSPKNPASKLPAKKDSVVAPQNIASPEIKNKIHLKDIVLSEDLVLYKKYDSKIDRSMKQKYAIGKLDAVKSDNFVYHIYDNLYSDSSVKVLLISRTWPEENIVWLAIYDVNDQLLDHQQVFYENSEGAELVETIIKDDLIKITTDNSYEENANTKKAVTWYINEKNKLVKK